VHIAARAFCLVVLLAAAGCAGSHRRGIAGRPFVFRADTFCYSNQLVWEYRIDPASGKTVTSKHEPEPEYTLHCFVVARAAKQFFNHARFDPTLPKVMNYGPLVRRVLGRSARGESSDVKKVVIPGYANLREFSRENVHLLQRECGGAWQSYFQRGHWRMIFPFTRSHQRSTATELVTAIEEHRPQIVHVLRFPSLAINHAMLIYDAQKTSAEIRFLAYDPNNADAPTVLTFSEADRRFILPPNRYFPEGGPVDVYTVFNGLLY
jgi:hypothetical protein